MKVATILVLVKKYWKWLLLLIVAAGIYFWIGSVKRAAYNQGVVAENTRWKKLVAEEEKKTKEFETTLAKVIKDYGSEVIEKSNKRVEKETTIREQVKTIVQNNPVYDQCLVDQTIIDKRNEIRLLGPSINKGKTDE